jgi:hypothetical protein
LPSRPATPEDVEPLRGDSLVQATTASTVPTTAEPIPIDARFRMRLLFAGNGSYRFHRSQGDE